MVSKTEPNAQNICLCSNESLLVYIDRISVSQSVHDPVYWRKGSIRLVTTC